MYVTIPGEKFEQSQICDPNQVLAGADRRLRAGANLFFEGDRVENLYQVVSGVLRLTRLLEDGRKQVIAFGYPGDIVGFPSNGLHHTDCNALVDAHLQSYRISALESAKSNPTLHDALLSAALREISGMQDHFMMLGRKSSVEKVASFLCVLTDRVGEHLGTYGQVQLPMSRADIADFLGLTTETVSRTFTHLRKTGMIAIDNIHTVIILKPTDLLALSLGDHGR